MSPSRATANSWPHDLQGGINSSGLGPPLTFNQVEGRLEERAVDMGAAGSDVQQLRQGIASRRDQQGHRHDSAENFGRATEVVRLIRIE